MLVNDSWSTRYGAQYHINKPFFFSCGSCFAKSVIFGVIVIAIVINVCMDNGVLSS